MQRRDVLFDVVRLAALAAVVPNDWRVIMRPRLADDPFQLDAVQVTSHARAARRGAGIDPERRITR